ncbi:MAG: MMPL family transporter [Clostridia bacterium]|nr:MMPL family transporter [Clostridia bacterium]
MHKLYSAIVQRRRRVMALYAIIVAVCLVFWTQVRVDYDIIDYLPDTAASTVAIDTLREEYEGGIPNCRVMIRDTDVPGALRYKEALRGIDGVTDVSWLDDAADMDVPLETLPKDTLETYYKDGNALFSVTIAEDDRRVQTIADIRALVGDDNCVVGSTVEIADSVTQTVSQVRIVAIIAVLYVFFILTLTTNSFAEPFLVLISIGIAIVINSGTNLIFGTISFVSNAAGAVLQLAVSLDYSVFLIHSFEDALKETDDKQEAMVQALCRSTVSILSSGLTTVIGFLALCMMRFRIGPDMGLVLAKGVFFSLLTVFTFSPALVLTFYDRMVKTRHRMLVPSFDRFARISLRFMIPMVLIFSIIVGPAFLASRQCKYYYGASHIFGLNTQLGRDKQEVETIFGKRDTYVLMVPRGDFVTEKKLSDELKSIRQVKSILSYVDNAGETIPTDYVPEGTRAKLLSPHYSRLVITVEEEVEGDAAFAFVEQIRAAAEAFYPGAWHLAGTGVSTTDLRDTIVQDTVRVNVVSVGAVFITLLFSFHSLSLPILLVAAIEGAIFINMGIPYFKDQYVFYMAYLIISSIQLGATVDYAILFTDNYVTNRKTMPKRAAIHKTVEDCTVSVITSGSAIIVVGYLMGYVCTHGLISQLGSFLGRGAVCSVIIVLFALPGMLYLLDGVIRRTTKGANFVKGA